MSDFKNHVEANACIAKCDAQLLELDAAVIDVQVRREAVNAERREAMEYVRTHTADGQLLNKPRTQRETAKIIGVDQSTIARTLDPKQREKDRKGVETRRDATTRVVASKPKQTSIVDQAIELGLPPRGDNETANAFAGRVWRAKEKKRNGSLDQAGFDHNIDERIWALRDHIGKVAPAHLLCYIQTHRAQWMEFVIWCNEQLALADLKGKSYDPT